MARLASIPEFRSVLYYRLRTGDRRDALAGRLLELWWPGQANLKIDCPSVGGGLVINHGYGTLLAALAIGEDCLVSQNVTLGITGRGGPPRVGDRVQLHAGAIVIGPIALGDDAIVGAGAVVTKDVPAGRTAVGMGSRLL